MTLETLNNCFHYKKLLYHDETLPGVQIVSIALWHLHVDPCEKKASILFAIAP